MPIARAGDEPADGRGGTARLRQESARPLDHFPKLRVVLKLFVLARGQVRPEEEIAERVPAQDAMDDDAEHMAFEVEAIVAEAVAGEGASVAGQGAEVGVLALEFLREAAELAEDVQLEVPGELAEFGGTGRIEDDLERLHPWAGFRVGEVEARRELKKERWWAHLETAPRLRPGTG